MPTQLIALVISLIALAVSLGGFLSARQAAWSMRYYERWFQMARLVLDHATSLHPLWCGYHQYQDLYAARIPADSEATAEELVFAEMYFDFVLEVHRRGRVKGFLTGAFPGRVPITNPRKRYLWDKHVRSLYGEREQQIVDQVIEQAG